MSIIPENPPSSVTAWPISPFLDGNVVFACWYAVCEAWSPFFMSTPEDL